MYVIRETMHCRPGKVKPMVEKFKAMADIMVKLGYPKPRILTDVSGEPYWTVIFESEAETLEAYFNMDDKAMSEAGMDTIMADYHDLVDHGGREILKVEF